MGKQKHKTLRERDHKEIGRRLSDGEPFKRILRDVETRTPYRSRSPRTQPRPTHQHPRPPFSNAHGGFQNGLRDVAGLLEFFAGLSELLGVLGIYATYGFTLLGTFLVLAYLAFWEIVGAAFDTIGREIPRPYRILWEIIEHIISTVAPGP